MCDNGSTVQVYHFGDVLSKARSVYRNHPSSQDHDLGRLHMISSDLFTYDSEGTPCRYGVPAALDQYPLPPPVVKFAVKDPLPRAEDFGEPSA